MRLGLTLLRDRDFPIYSKFELYVNTFKDIKMKLDILSELKANAHGPSFQFELTRDAKDYKKIQELDREVHGGRGYKPPVGEIVLVAKKDGKIVGYSIAKPYRNTAYNRRWGVHPDYQNSGLAKELAQKMLRTCRDQGFKYTTARSKDDTAEWMKDLYGEPTSTRKTPRKKTIKRFKKDLLLADDEEEELPGVKNMVPTPRGGPAIQRRQTSKAQGGGYA